MCRQIPRSVRGHPDLVVPDAFSIGYFTVAQVLALKPVYIRGAEKRYHPPVAIAPSRGRIYIDLRCKLDLLLSELWELLEPWTDTTDHEWAMPLLSPVNRPQPAKTPLEYVTCECVLSRDERVAPYWNQPETWMRIKLPDAQESMGLFTADANRLALGADGRVRAGNGVAAFTTVELTAIKRHCEKEAAERKASSRCSLPERYSLVKRGPAHLWGQSARELIAGRAIARGFVSARSDSDRY